MEAAVAERQEAEIIDMPQQNSVAAAVAVYRAPDLAAMKQMDMLDKAIALGNVEVIGRIMDYQDRWENNEKRKAFNNALADAKAEIKPIIKNRQVAFEAKNGGASVDYEHEDLAGIAEQIDEVLSRHGLFYRWRTENDFDTGKISVTCIVSHRRGHEETNTLHGKVDAGAGKNHLQALGSAQTYLERYTLKAALGLAAKNDDDGRAAGGFIDVQPDRGRADKRAPDQRQAMKITATQAYELKEKLEAAKEKGADEAQFWVFAQATKVEDVSADRYPTILSALKTRYGV